MVMIQRMIYIGSFMNLKLTYRQGVREWQANGYIRLRIMYIMLNNDDQD